MVEHEGRSALMCASAHGHAATMQLLLDAEADTGLVDNRGLTALAHAASAGVAHRLSTKIDIQRSLLAAGADERTLYGGPDAPLLFAATHDYHEIALWMMVMGSANKDCADSQGRTAILGLPFHPPTE